MASNTHHKSYICYNFKTFSRTYSNKKYKYANLEPEHKHSTCTEIFEKRDVQCFQKWNSYVPNVQIHKFQNVHAYLIMISTHHRHPPAVPYFFPASLSECTRVYQSTKWQHLATNGNFWLQMATFCNNWQLLATNGNFWKQMATFSNKWQLLATFGNKWQLLATMVYCRPPPPLWASLT